MTGNQIRKAIEELGITQEIAAEKLGINLRTLQGWMSQDEVSAKIARTFRSVFAGENNTNHSHNVTGNWNKINSETDKFLDLLKKKDEQIDRLITLLEKR